MRVARYVSHVSYSRRTRFGVQKSQFFAPLRGSFHRLSEPEGRVGHCPTHFSGWVGHQAMGSVPPTFLCDGWPILIIKHALENICNHICQSVIDVLIARYASIVSFPRKMKFGVQKSQIFAPLRGASYSHHTTSRVSALKCKLPDLCVATF